MSDLGSAVFSAGSCAQAVRGRQRLPQTTADTRVRARWHRPSRARTESECANAIILPLDRRLTCLLPKLLLPDLDLFDDLCDPQPHQCGRESAAQTGPCVLLACPEGSMETTGPLEGEKGRVEPEERRCRRTLAFWSFDSATVERSTARSSRSSAIVACRDMERCERSRVRGGRRSRQHSQHSADFSSVRWLRQILFVLEFGLEFELVLQSGHLKCRPVGVIDYPIGFIGRRRVV